MIFDKFAVFIDNDRLDMTMACCRGTNYKLNSTPKKRLFLSPPHMSGSEMDFIQEAFNSNYIAPLGPQVDAFEKEFCEKVGFSHAVALSSGTAAIHLALLNLGVASGDIVMASTLTFIGGVSPITYLDAVPVFIDCDYETWTMDPDLLAEGIRQANKMGQLPKAIVPTDLYGQSVNLDRIIEICKPFDIPVVVDSAEALGSTYKGRSAGASAKAAVFSFNGNKIITTSGGGMLASNDKDLIDNARFFSQQARNPVPHYEHSQIGYNYRMSNILAAIGQGQLKVLDERVKQKQWINKIYIEALGSVDGIEFMPEASYGKSNKWLTVVLITPEKFGADRETVRLALEEQNIEARPMWKPMHLQKVFAGCHSVGGSVSEDLFKRGLCLPSGTAMTENDIVRIVRVILDCKR